MNVLDASGLIGSFRGRLVSPADADYDAIRALHNGLVSKRPALIARCSSTADVVEALRFARESGLAVAVRGGGHNVAGRASVDGGLMIDLSTMKSVQVDPDTRVARAEGGVTWGELNAATQAHGLATTGGVVSSTGIAGLTLGGGVGWLMGRFGLAVDNLLSAEIVTADGRVLTASAADHPDLFWAIRGGGGNFGIATRFDYALHPVGPLVTAGMVAHPLSEGVALLRHYRKVTADAPDDLTIFAGMVHAPDASGARLAVAVACHCGTPDAAARDLEPLRRFGSPLLDTIGPTDYSTLNTAFDASLPKGALNYWKACMLESLTDRTIDALVDAYAACPSPMGQMFIEHLHGAAVRVPEEATAFPHRRPGYNVLALSQWLDPVLTERCTRWARDTYAAIAPADGLRRYVNYLDDDEEQHAAMAAAYGPNYRRLRRVKAAYDPGNVFCLNQNILPEP